MTDVQDMPDLYLPPQFTLLRRLLRVLGGPVTLELLRARGGRFLTIPKGTDSDLVEQLGADNVEKLRAEFGVDERLTLPMADKIEAKIRNAAIWTEMDAGVSISTQAGRYHLSMRQVLNIRRMKPQAGDPEPTPQGQLPF